MHQNKLTPKQINKRKTNKPKQTNAEPKKHKNPKQTN